MKHAPDHCDLCRETTPRVVACASCDGRVLARVCIPLACACGARGRDVGPDPFPRGAGAELRDVADPAPAGEITPPEPPPELQPARGPESWTSASDAPERGSGGRRKRKRDH